MNADLFFHRDFMKEVEMAWFWSRKENKVESDRRVGERRAISTEQTLKSRISRFFGVALPAIGWTFLWLVGLPLACVGVIGAWYFVDSYFDTSSLESFSVVVSILVSEFIYTVDIRTGWFSYELPEVLRLGAKEYLLAISSAFYLKVAGVVSVGLTGFFVAICYKKARWAASLIAVVLSGGAAAGWYAALDPVSAPPIYGTQLRDFRMREATHVTDTTGTVEIGCFAHENRTVVPLAGVSQNLINAILASEDHKFYEHEGFNLYAIVRAAVANAMKAKIASGASTITMQLTKNVFLTPEKSLTRKAKEAVISVHLEHALTKEELLALYVNLVYFGGSYGVEAASQSYFLKSAKDVTIAEAAFLAALINQPEAYRRGGTAGKKTIMARQVRVIDLMVKRGMISDDEARLAKDETLVPSEYKGTCTRTEAYINAAVNREFGINRNIPIASAGFNIQTTIELPKQKVLDAACRKAIADHLKRRPENTDTIRCSSVVVRTKTGEVVAMVNGQNFKTDQFDHVMQADRQAGSSFKPFVFAAYLEKIEQDQLALRAQRCLSITEEECKALTALPMDLLSLCNVLDAPVLVPSIVGWKKKIISRHPISNYPYEARPQHRGMISCALALGESRNTATIWAEGQLAPREWGELERWVYGAKTVVAMAHRLGIESPLEHKSVTGKTEEERAQSLPNYTIGIGSAEVNLWEMAEAYLPLINGGCRQHISFIKKAIDANGKVIYEHGAPAPCERVLSPRVASAMRDLLEAPIDVRGLRQSNAPGDVLLGTAASLRTPFPKGKLCGKTGTAGEMATDNWFAGCTTDYLVVTRLNNVNQTWLGKKETGGKNALPVFEYFIRTLELLDPNATFPPIDTSVVWQPTVVPAPAPTLSMVPAR